MGGAVHEFGYEDIVKGSGYISCQCCGNTEIELGTVYAAEMGDYAVFSDRQIHIRGCEGRAVLSS